MKSSQKKIAEGRPLREKVNQLWEKEVNIKKEVNIIVGLFIAVLLSVPLLSYGDPPLNLYTTNVLVADQSEVIRRQRISEGLSTVIVRLSGKKSALQHPDIQLALKNASSYLYEFSYHSIDEELLVEGTPQNAIRLVLRFSEEPVQRLLEQARLPLWSSNRPKLLVWSAVNDKGVSNADLNAPIVKQLKEATTDRGLSFSLPVLDRQDRRALPITRLRAIDEGAVRVASRRYQAEAVLAGRFRQGGGQWAASFIFLHKDKTHYLTAKNRRQSVVVTSIIDQVAEHLATVYAVTPSASPSGLSVSLRVHEINNFSAYTAVLNYLQALVVVDTLILEEVDNQQIQVGVYLNADLDPFLNILRLDRKLQQVNTVGVRTLPVPANGQAREALDFTWR